MRVGTGISNREIRPGGTAPPNAYASRDQPHLLRAQFTRLLHPLRQLPRMKEWVFPCTASACRARPASALWAPCSRPTGTILGSSWEASPSSPDLSVALQRSRSSARSASVPLPPRKWNTSKFRQRSKQSRSPRRTAMMSSKVRDRPRAAPLPSAWTPAPVSDWDRLYSTKSR